MRERVLRNLILFVGALCVAGTAALPLYLTGRSASAQQQPCDFLTGGGFITTTASGTHAAAQATFAIAGGCKKGLPTWGHLQYQDKGNGLNAHWSSITGYNIEGTDGIDPSTGQPTGTRVICGTARTNLYGNVDFVVRTRDRGEPGTSDAFDIRLRKFINSIYTTVYATTPTVSGTILGGGNIQLHKPNSSTAGSFGGTCPAGVDPPTQPGPDVMVSKSTDTPALTTGGGEVRFQLVVDNAAAGSTATNVTLTDDLPTGASGTLVWTIVPAVPGCSIPDGHTLTCNFASLASGTANDITINVRATATQADCPDGLINVATVSAENEAPAQQGNNTSGEVVILACQE
jgi:uncharacterized repeat protein (TIGR01451 family)